MDSALARAQARRQRLLEKPQQGTPAKQKPAADVDATPPPKARVTGKRAPNMKATPAPDNTPVLTPGQKHLKPQQDDDAQKRKLEFDMSSDLP